MIKDEVTISLSSGKTPSLIAKNIPCRKLNNWDKFKDLYKENLGGARGVMVIVVGNGHGDSSSNPGRDRLHFT